MQVNDLVKVKDGRHEGRAGVVIKSDEYSNTVRLDATPELATADEDFTDSELQFLGR